MTDLPENIRNIIYQDAEIYCDKMGLFPKGNSFEAYKDASETWARRCMKLREALNLIAYALPVNALSMEAWKAIQAFDEEIQR